MYYLNLLSNISSSFEFNSLMNFSFRPVRLNLSFIYALSLESGIHALHGPISIRACLCTFWLSIWLLFNFDFIFRLILRPFFQVPFKLGHIMIRFIAVKELINLGEVKKIIRPSFHLVKDLLDLFLFAYYATSSLDQIHFH